jgi:5'-nucleotidase (lipoprotein e(P4) family)
MLRWIPLVALSLTTASCATSSAPPPATPGAQAATATAEPFRATKSVRWMQDSAERRALSWQIFRAATAHVEEAAATRESGTWAVVADADETLIDNALYQVEREKLGPGFTRESWHEWTKRQTAIPLPGARTFLARVRDLGGKIAVVTNRRESECADTSAVFGAHGLAYDVILCRPDDGPSDKNPRFAAVRNGTTPAELPPLEVVTFLGDNIRDFPDQSQELVKEGDKAFADFGARFFVLPNPMYGSWE